MAKATRKIIFECMEMLPEALTPFVEKRLDNALSGHWQIDVAQRLNVRAGSNGAFTWDQQALLKAIMVYWKEAFSNVLGHAERSYVSEILEIRNRLSHNEHFSYDDTERALDTMRRLCDAISAQSTATAIGKMRDAVLRVKFDELARTQARKKSEQQQAMSMEIAAGLKPWRDVVEPHDDVATGQFKQAEFAADLSQVYMGIAPDEYRKPKEFFSRTYLTDGLSDLLEGAAKRLSGTGGDPVVELMTNFGGGKTHSMLALYHMAGATDVKELAGLDALFREKSLSLPNRINRAVLVGTSRGANDPAKDASDAPIITKEGRRIFTTWGEMAWQLGGEEAYSIVAEQDASGVAPGSAVLIELFNQCSPCLILIDEWVAYLRQIYKVDGLASGSFDSNLSFVQSLTEAVKACPTTLLVASLPASQIEVGGEGGAEALDRLRQTFSRVESSWRPASQEESYEIVRRRLFKPISSDLHLHKDNAIKLFTALYRDNPDSFPTSCDSADYRRLLEKAYPIHPELFDQLYSSWGALENFQRTRGVLRLMAQVVHELWMQNDPSAMVMPGSVTVGSSRVGPELMHYLSHDWQSIIAKDVDGTSSMPYQIDQEVPAFNRVTATRRVARTIFMGTAPTARQENTGLDQKKINLGVIQPGEKIAVFGDAVRRLSTKAQYLHTSDGRYWYSESASLNRTAADKAAAYEDALIDIKLEEELKKYVNSLADRGHFNAIHVTPASSADIPDEPGGVNVVFLGLKHPHKLRGSSEAEPEAEDILQHRGQAPRENRNTLVFIAADQTQLEPLRSSMRNYLAWKSILEEKARLNLTQSDELQASDKRNTEHQALKSRLKETWHLLLYPYQEMPTSNREWSSHKLSPQEGILVSASRVLSKNQSLITEMGPITLYEVLRKTIWNGKPHLKLGEVWDYLNKFIYLPRIRGQESLRKTVLSAVSSLDPGPFAYAEKWDEATETYQGLLTQQAMNAVIAIDASSVIIKPEIAQAAKAKQVQPENSDATREAVATSSPSQATAAQNTAGNDQCSSDEQEEPEDSQPKNFSGTVIIDPYRPAHQMRPIIEGIIEQLTDITRSDVTIKLEIDAFVPDGIGNAKIRTLRENSNVLKFVDVKID